MQVVILKNAANAYLFIKIRSNIVSSKINEALGYDMTNAAEAYEVYLAMILYRLVTNE